MFAFLLTIFLFSLTFFMWSGLLYETRHSINWSYTQLPEVMLIASGSISFIILLHIIIGLSRCFYILNKIKNETKRYTKQEFLNYIDTQQDVPTLNTKNAWLVLGYSIKEYIYKGKANRKHISKNLFDERFVEN